MNKDDIIRMAQEAGATEVDETDPQCRIGDIAFDTDELERFYRLAHAAGEKADRDRTARLVADMQNELQTLRDRLAKQKPRIWIYRDNPGLTTMREPGNPDLWEPLGNIV